MGRIGVLCLFVILLFIKACSTPKNESNEHDNLILGTASREGNYYPLGQSIKSIMDSISTGIKLDVIETDGSVDNILKLRNGKIDIAIVQNDVAFFAENGLDPFDEEITNLNGIASFYSEPIYIVTNNKSINSLVQLVNKRTNIGPIKSGLYTDAKIILNYFKLWSKIKKRNLSPKKGITAVSNGSIDAAFVNVLSKENKDVIKKGNLNLIPISAASISLINKTYPYFTKFTTPLLNSHEFTIAVKAILVCREDLNSKIVNSITKSLYNNSSKLKLPEYSPSLIPKQLISSMPLDSFHPGARKYYQKVNLLHSQKALWISGLILLSITAIIILIFLSNYFYLSKLSSNHRFIHLNKQLLKLIKKSHNFVTQHKYLVVCFFLVTVYITIIILVKKIEHLWAIQNNTVSNFDNRSFSKNLLWIFIFGGSGYEDNLFPSSPLSKFLVTLIPLIGIGGFLALAGLFTSDHIKNRLLKARGIKSDMVKDHIILCGWNDNVPFLINNLQHDNIVNKKPVVLLADPEEEMPLEANNIDKDLVTFVRGKATKKNDLIRANIRDAEIAIIIADSSSSEPDAKSILKILTIEKYCRQLEKEGKREGRKNIYTVAEIQDTENFDSAYDADVDEIISLGHIKSKIFVHSVLNPGVSNLINEVLTYNEFNDFYSIPVTKNSALLDKTFDELLLKLRRRRILLLSISISNHKGRKEVEKIKNKHNLNRTVLTNPITENEINYKTQPEDLLIVLADYEQTIQKAIKEYNH